MFFIAVCTLRRQHFPAAQSYLSCCSQHNEGDGTASRSRFTISTPQRVTRDTRRTLFDCGAGISTKPRGSENPLKAMFVRVAREKAMDVASRVAVPWFSPRIPSSRLTGKFSESLRIATMQSGCSAKLSGREHRVYTAVCVIDQTRGQSARRTRSARPCGSSR